MTDNISLIVRQGDTYKHYEGCEIKSISAKCDDCSFFMATHTGTFKSWQMDMLHAHVESGHNTRVTCDLTAEKVSDVGCPYGHTSNHRAIS